MAKQTFSAHGFSYEFEDNSGEIMKAFENALERGLEAVGMTAEGYAKRDCPVGTPESTGIPGYIGGTLRNSITFAVRDDEVYIGSNVEYAPFVELGTSKMKAKPFLKPAASEHSSEYRKILEDSFENA